MMRKGFEQGFFCENIIEMQKLSIFEEFFKHVSPLFSEIIFPT